MTGPLPEPPAPEVAELLDQLREARREMHDAGRVVELLTAARADVDRAHPHDVARYWIESSVAERRVEEWALRVRTLVDAARSLGLDVADPWQ